MEDKYGVFCYDTKEFLESNVPHKLVIHLWGMDVRKIAFFKNGIHVPVDVSTDSYIDRILLDFSE